MRRTIRWWQSVVMQKLKRPADVPATRTAVPVRIVADVHIVPAGGVAGYVIRIHSPSGILKNLKLQKAGLQILLKNLHQFLLLPRRPRNPKERKNL